MPPGCPISFEGVHVPADASAAIREEIERAGVKGRILIGPIRDLPEWYYFLAHEHDKRPIAIIVSHDDLTTSGRARQTAQRFVQKWRSRVAARHSASELAGRPPVQSSTARPGL
jgi:hypothetical protein